MRSNRSWNVGLKAAFVFVAVLLLAVLCIAAPRAVGRLAPIWLANAVIVSVYLRSPARQWPLIALAGFSGNILANFLASDHVGVALTLSTANVLECLACGLLVRRVIGEQFDTSRMAHLVQFAMAAAAAACGSSLIASTGLEFFTGAAVVHSMSVWMSAHVLGLMTLTPCLILFARGRGPDEPTLREHGWAVAVLGAVAVATFAQSSFPLLFLIPPALLLVVWRLELFGSALGVLLTAAIGISFSLAGHGPTSLVHGDANAKIFVLQAFLLVCILSSLPVANQRSLSRKLQASLTAALKVAEGETLKLDMATSVAKLGHWTLDLGTGEFAWSRQMYEIFGVDNDGKADLAVAMGRVHPDDQPECQRLVDRAIAFGEDYSQEQIRIFRPDGEMRITGGHVVCQRDESGAVVSLFGTLSDKTEATQAELRRTYLEQRYAEIAAKANDIVLRLDGQGVCLSVNPACKAVLGYDPAEIEGRTMGWLVHPEEYDRMRAALLALRNGGEITERLLYRARHRDGGWMWLESQPQATRDPVSGALIETSDVIRDVTARVEYEAALKRAEAAAQEANTLMRSAEKMAHMGYLTYDLGTQTMVWSDEVWNILEMDPAVDTPNYEIFQQRRHPEDRAAAAEAFEKALASNEDSFESHYRLLLPSGAIRHVAARGHIRRENGEPVSVFGIMVDVTHLREAEDAARESDRRYRLMAHNATDVIVTSGMDGLITFVSPAIKTIAGHESEPLIGQRASAFAHPDDAPAMEAAFARLARGGAAERVRWRGWHVTEKRWLWLESSPALLRDAGGRPSGFLDVVRDVTAQKAQEDALAQARLDAEAAMRSKADFLANMSHELRTPLNSIIGFSRLLKEGSALAGEDRRRVELVYSAGQALHAVIDNVLDFSKLEAAALELYNAPFDPAEFVLQTMAMLEPQAAAKDVALNTAIEGDLSGLVLGDIGRLRQVLLNLLSNAVKFTSRGKVTTRLIRKSVRGGKARLRVEVIDTGAGIAADKIDGLFSRFTQAESSVSAHYGGTGLGLAISRQLIELMGGKVGVKSKLGAGSTFWFELTLPVAEAHDGAAAPAPTPAANIAGKRVLVVDDIELNRELMLAMLGGEGCLVSLAEDGAEALALLETQGFDLVLMDCQMPVMDGFEATRRIRASGAPYAAIPIIALTASATPEHLARCDAAGMDGHLAKPLSPLALEAVLRRYLGDTPAETEAPGPAKAAREELVEQFGPQAVIKLLALLLDQLSSKLPSDLPADQVGEDAHALAGAAGMMGYDALSAACRRLEQVVEDGLDHTALLTEVRAMIAEATVDATAWTADLEARASVAA